MNYYETLPKKRMGAGAILLNAYRQILIVKPIYRQDWLLPGGCVEADESPAQGCRREVTEELGLLLPLERALVIDYLPREGEKTEALQFIFFGGKLHQEHIQSITLQEEELSDYRFVSIEEALQLLSPNTAQRITYALQALKEGTTIYLEQGKPL